MKYPVIFILFICLALPAFSQSRDTRDARAKEANNQRYKALGDAISRTASNSASNLEYYDDLVLDSGNTKNYTQFVRKHRSLTKSLRESEERLDFELRTNGRNTTIREERDKYEGLTKQAEDLKAEYDDWLKNK